MNMYSGLNGMMKTNFVFPLQFKLIQNHKIIMCINSP